MLHSPQFISCYITITGPDDDSMEATSKSVLLNTNNRDEDEVDQEVEVHNEKNIVRKEDDGEDYYYYQKYYHPAERRFDE